METPNHHGNSLECRVGSGILSENETLLFGHRNRLVGELVTPIRRGIEAIPEILMRGVLLACVTVFVACGCLCGGCPNHNYPDNGTYVHAERENRKKLTEPVIEALEKYKDVNGRYPDRLEALVAAGQLPAVPDLASNTDHLGKTGDVEKAQPLRYAVVGDGYELQFSFSHIRPALTASDTSYFLYVSQEKKWYLTFGESGGPPPVFHERKTHKPRRSPQRNRDVHANSGKRAANRFDIRDWGSHPKKTIHSCGRLS